MRAFCWHARRSWSMGQVGYFCAVLLAPKLRFDDLAAPCRGANPPRILPLLRTPTIALTTVPRPADHTMPLPKTADAPIRTLDHGIHCTQTPPQRDCLGHPARTGHGNVRSFGSLVAPRPLGRSIYDPLSFCSHQPPPSTAPTPPAKDPLLRQGRLEDSQPRPWLRLTPIDPIPKASDRWSIPATVDTCNQNSPGAEGLGRCRPLLVSAAAYGAVPPRLQGAAQGRSVLWGRVILSSTRSTHHGLIGSACGLLGIPLLNRTC